MTFWIQAASLKPRRVLQKRNQAIIYCGLTFILLNHLILNLSNLKWQCHHPEKIQLLDRVPRSQRACVRSSYELACIILQGAAFVNTLEHLLTSQKTTQHAENTSWCHFSPLPPLPYFSSSYLPRRHLHQLLFLLSCQTHISRVS